MWTFPDAAVDRFFCLSGFTLCLAYRIHEDGKLPFLKYLQARIARIYPLYALSLFLMWWLVIRHLGGSAYYPAAIYKPDIIRNVLMVNSWPLIGSGSNWNFPAWSLSVEVFCYIFLFPLFKFFYRTLCRIPDEPKVWACVLLSLFSVIMFKKYWDGDLVSATLHHQRHILPYWIPIVRATTMFSCGWIVYTLFETRSKIGSFCSRYLDYLTLAAILYLIICEWLPLAKDGLAVFCPFLILGLSTDKNSYASRFLGSRPIYLLGVISYSLYVLHVPVYYELHYVWPSLRNDQPLDLCVTLLVITMVSTISYYCFEMPARSLIKAINLRHLVNTGPPSTQP